MTESPRSRPSPDESADCISEVRRLANTHVPGLKQPDNRPEEWHVRLRALEQWICELLIENQRLRMSFKKETEPMPGRDYGQNG